MAIVDWLFGRQHSRPSRLDAREARAWAFACERLNLIYGAGPATIALQKTVLDRVLSARATRPPKLTALDKARLTQPDWFQKPDQIGYSFYVDRFADTLKGTIDKLDHLASLGVTYLHPLPLLHPRDGDSDGGFAVADYRAVDPRLGTMDDLEALADAAHKRNMALCLDVVCNHTAREHDWAVRARAGDPEFQAYYHVVDTATDVATLEASLSQVFPQTAPGNFTYDPELGAFVWTTFYPYQWDLNYRNPQVFLAMLDVLMDLSNRGVDAFRLDSTAFLWKEPRTDCRGLPQTHWIVQAWRALLEIAAPGVLLQAEAIVEAESVLGFFGTEEARGRESHLAYNNASMVALWAGLALEDATALTKIIKIQQERPQNASWISYLRCHDDVIWSALDGVIATDDLHKASAFYAGIGRETFSLGHGFQAEQDAPISVNGMTSALVGLRAQAGPEAFARYLFLHQMMFALDGLPTLWMGDECALGDNPDFAKDAGDTGEGRWWQRPRMDWSLAAETAPWPHGPMLAEIRKLCALRRKLPALHSGRSAEPLDLPLRGLGAFVRTHPISPLICMGNFTGQTITLDRDVLPPLARRAKLSCALTNETLNGPTIAFAPWQVRWIIRN